ncbi:hypothetical protein [Roseovarius aestuariivivens]|uniref:hypothetical protein n=1 Tax=Roseovarius aestuariivivens TaxID=1888910 RepID=UPI001FD9E475|nr:hypothetical protein [Roseovarius aestuariivivens]
MILALLTSMALLTGPALAATVDGQQTYDLLFKNGTLDDLEHDKQLVYTRDVINAAKTESAAHNSGKIALGISNEDETLANLMFRQGERYRKMGSFPANVGNPMIMVFYESVVRDMAETAGGSPFYIRNRVKETLVEPSNVEVGEAMLNGHAVQTKTIRLRPFENDPNRDRMKGFGDLVLSVTMSEDVPGWYLSFEAEVIDSATGEPIYMSVTTFDGKKDRE